MSVDSIQRIDEMATKGYEVAVSGGVVHPKGLESDLDFLAFNAGISHANIKVKYNDAFESEMSGVYGIELHHKEDKGWTILGADAEYAGYGHLAVRRWVLY